MRLCLRVDGPWAQNRVTSGLSSAEGLISELQDTDPPIDRRLLVVQSEFASVLKIMRRAGNTLSPLLRAAWDNGNLRTLVKSNPLKATSAHISIIGHITSPELLRNLSDELTNGFANRLLWCCIKRSKFLPEGGSVPEAEIASLSRRLRGVLEWRGALAILNCGEIMQRAICGRLYIQASARANPDRWVRPLAGRKLRCSDCPPSMLPSIAAQLYAWSIYRQRWRCGITASHPYASPSGKVLPLVVIQ
jgi:hypothetical protein